MGNPQTADDRFKKFGTKSFVSLSKVNDFIDHLEAGRVMGTRCIGCKQVFFPPRADCCQCLAGDVEWFEISGNGKLVTFSQLQYAPAGFEADVPYSVALVAFETCKVFGRIASDVSEEDIRVGMPVKIVVNRLPNGQLNYVFQKT